MYRKFIFVLFIFLIFISCSKKELEYETKIKSDPYVLYKEGFEAFEKGQYFFADKKFSEAELNFENVDFAAKSAIMSCYALYGINFYDEALENLDRYLSKYPADENVQYAHYLIAIIHFEQISDEKDLKPLIDANKKIDFFLKKYPNSDYAIDLKFKKDLITNQLAAVNYLWQSSIYHHKNGYAINRLKIIIEKYDQTIFIEELFIDLLKFIII